MGGFIKRLVPVQLKRRINEYLISKYKPSYLPQPSLIKLFEEGRMKGKVAVVTGGSGAIGREICLRLAAEGAIVYVGGMIESKISDVVDEIKNIGSEGYPLKIDVTNISHIEEAFQSILKKEVRIDMLITCAGGSARDKSNLIINQDIKVIESVLDTNLNGTIFCCKEAAKYMVKNRIGKIVTLSSTIGLQGKVEFSDYAAAKGGVVSFTKSLAMELGQYGINVNCVSPGIILRENLTDERIERIKKTNYLNSHGKPEDIANMIAFLVSDEAAFITGQNFVVDGGRSLGLKGD